MNKKWLYPLLHLLAWTLLAISATRDFMDGYAARPYDTAWVNALGWPPVIAALCRVLIYQAVSMVAFYTAYAWLAPAIFPKKRYGLACISVIGICTAMVATRYIMEFWIARPLLHFDNYFGRPVNPWWYITNCIGYSYNYCLFGLLLSFLIHSGRVQQEKAAAELAFLRSQINPHFLFNTINDIYSLVYQQRKEAPEAILKLSGILRYTLYEENRDSVSLEKELAYLQDYLDLQRIGAGEASHIDFRIQGDATSLNIAPLLLIPFAENIIKHGVIDDPRQPATLHIKIEERNLNIVAENHVKERQKDPSGGIGLHNVRRRLELLYPAQHRFKVEDRKTQFRCELNLTLKT
ncbi:MAG: sensor histidine kinase [Bacteroidetes bacterium]|nr:sensor histidine kinase [Bacteroidota bacterium]